MLLKEANAEGSDEPGTAADVHQQCLKENEVVCRLQPFLHFRSSCCVLEEGSSAARV